MDPSKSNLQSSQFQQAQEKKMSKKQRNRHSSRTLRARKKQQQEQLEWSVSALEKELRQKQIELTSVQGKISNFLIRNQMNNSFNHEQSQKYQELQQLCLQDGSQQDEINLLLDVLITRIGVTGKQRNRKVEYYSNKLINFSFPAIYRYLLKASYHKADFYAANQYKWTQSLSQALQLTQSQIAKFIAIQEHLQTQYAKVAFDVQEFRKTKSQLYNVSVQIEEQVLQWRTLLTPSQCGRFIIQIQKRKHNQYMELAQQTNKTKKIRKIQ